MSRKVQLNRVLDPHCHLFNKRRGVEWLPNIDLFDFHPRDLIAIARKHGVTTGLTQTRYEMGESLHYLGCAQAASEIDIAFPWLDLQQPKVLLEETIADLQGRFGTHFAGMRHLVQYPDDGGPIAYFSRLDTQAGMDIWGETKLPFKICVKHHQIEQVVRFITGQSGMKRRDSQPFIIDHNFKERCVADAPSEVWLNAVDALSGYHNIFFQFSGFFGEDTDVSWFSLEGAKVRFGHLVKKLGHSRIIFGSDCPMFHGSGKTYGDVLDTMIACAEAAGLSQSQFNDVMGNNLRRVCNLT